MINSELDASDINPHHVHPLLYDLLYHGSNKKNKNHSNLIKVDLISVISKQSDYAVRTVDLALCYYLSVW